MSNTKLHLEYKGDLGLLSEKQARLRKWFENYKDFHAQYESFMRQSEKWSMLNEDHLAMLTKLQSEYFERNFTAIKSVIEMVPNEQLKLILTLRYLESMTWERIAETMHYSVMQCTRIHKIAIARAVDIAPKEVIETYKN